MGLSGIKTKIVLYSINSLRLNAYLISNGIHLQVLKLTKLATNPMSVSGKILSYNMQVKRPITTSSVSLGQFLLKSQCSLTPITSPNHRRRKTQTRANMITIHCIHV